MWRRTRADATHKATWQRHANPHERLRGADAAWTHGRATRALAWRYVAGGILFWLADDGPTCIVGPCNSIGAVTQMQKGISHLYLHFPLTSSMWDNVPLNVASHGASDVIGTGEICRSH